jgi:hypothetical protein
LALSGYDVPCQAAPLSECIMAKGSVSEPTTPSPAEIKRLRRREKSGARIVALLLEASFASGTFDDAVADLLLSLAGGR